MKCVIFSAWSVTSSLVCDWAAFFHCYFIRAVRHPVRTRDSKLERDRKLIIKLTLLHMLCPIPRKEILQILRSSYLRGLNMASFFAGSKIIVFVTFTVYVLLGNTISASTVFVTVSLYGTIKLTVTLFFPLAVEKLSETVVSIRRIKVILPFRY